MNKYKDAIPGIMFLLLLAFLFLYFVNPLGKELVFKRQLTLLFSVVSIASIWRRHLYNLLWMVLVVASIIYYFIV